MNKNAYKVILLSFLTLCFLVLGQLQAFASDGMTAGFTITGPEGTTSESGDTATIAVKLKSAPTDDVVINVSSGNTDEFTVMPETLTFTAQTWADPQTVTAYGVDDLVDDGDTTNPIILAAAISSDSIYNGLDPDDVMVVNIDDDTAGIMLNNLDTEVSEGDVSDSGAIGVRLSSIPGSDVTVAFDVSDATEGAIDTASIMFTPSNWDTEQYVEFHGLDDFEDDDNKMFEVQYTTSSSDTNYDELTDHSYCTNIDNDSSGYTISPISGTTSDGGRSASFTIRLNSDPLDDNTVTIGITSLDTDEVTVFPASINFTDENWDDDQTVTVTGAEDGTADGDQTVIIEMVVTASGDTIYMALNPDDVSVENKDEHTVEFVAGTGGSISGTLSQQVATSGSSVSVTAVPDSDYGFGYWDGDYYSTENPLTISGVAGNMTVTANFVSKIVTNTNESGPGSLREVLTYAGDGDTVSFDASVSGTITLSSMPLIVTADVFINGPGADVLTVSGGGGTNVFEIGSGKNVTLSGLTITNGYDDNGGGILNSGNLTIYDCVISGNNSTGYGGGISNDGGSLQITESTISGNTATRGGGGIHNKNGSTAIHRSTISGNDAWAGGGILNMTSVDVTALVTIENSTISGNTATGPKGGGIHNEPQFSYSGTSGLPDPPAPPGSSGGTATVQLTFATITNNTSTEGKGGGIYGYAVNGVSRVQYLNTIIAGNTADSGADCYNENGFMNSLGCSMVDDAVSASPGAGDVSVVDGDPKLGPLADNGGPTLTHALLSGCKAINAASTNSYELDQRGNSRVFGSLPDIGAYESSAWTVNFSAGSGGSISGTTNQTVSDGGNATSVTAVPSSGYVFTGWDGDYQGTENPLTIENVTSDMSVSANFVLDGYTVVFTSGSGGTISGTTSQVVAEEGSTTSVTAVPSSGYHFVGWGGDYEGKENPLTIENVTSNMSITANFELDSYTVAFIAGNGGTVTGTTTQVVALGGTATRVTAVPSSGYVFTGWSGDYQGTENPLTLGNVTSNMNITANFRLNGFTVSFTAENGGSLTGSTSQMVSNGGSTSEVRAVAATGYRFDGWAGDFTGTANPLIITNVTKNMNVRAVFVSDVYNVTFTSGANGSLQGAQSQTVAAGGSTTSITAVPNSNYVFIGWSGDYSGTANPLTLSNVQENKLVKAEFERIQYTAVFTAGEGGTIEGSAEQMVYHGDSASPVTAVANTGYEFSGWSGDASGTGNPLTVSNVVGNISITANFTPLEYNLTFSAGDGGSLQGAPAQIVSYGQNAAEITAVPAEGYEFTGWSGDYGGTDNPLVVTGVVENMDIKAEFAPIPHTVRFSAMEGGTISGEIEQTVLHGGSTSGVSVSPMLGYEFMGWSGDYEGNDNPLVLDNVSGDMEITALFSPQLFAVTFSAGEGGSLQGEAQQMVGYGTSNSEVTAVPAEGYKFIGWTGSYEGLENPLSMNVTGEMSFSANFEPAFYAVTFTSGENGSINGELNQTIQHGTSTSSVEAVPAEGFEFDSWNGDLTGTDNPLVIDNVTADMSLSASFKQKLYTVQFTVSEGGSLQGATEQQIAYGGESSPVTAVPAEGYDFSGWSDGSNENPHAVTNVSDNISLTANFARKQYTLSFSAANGGSLEGSSSQTVEHGASGSAVTAVPFTGYDFAGWSGDYDGNDNPLVLSNVQQDMSVTAMFTNRNYAVVFTAQQGGSISGESSQSVSHGGSSRSVTAVPAEGYEFTGWSGDYSGNTNPLTLSDVHGNMTVTANFAQRTFTVRFRDSEGGSLSGDTTQQVAYGEGSSSVTAVPAEGYDFAGWTGGYNGSDNPLTFSSVTGDVTVTAQFSRRSYTVSFSAGENGSIQGDSPQTVGHGTSATSVTAVPAENYEFVGWSGDYSGTDNPLTLTDVDSNMSVTALFGRAAHFVTFSSGEGGSVSGELSQTVAHGSGTSPVTAVPAEDYRFISWSGGYEGSENPLTVQNVTVDMTITANFARLVHSLTVTGPSAGDRVPAGSPVAVSWVSENVKALSIEYSTDGGSNWISIASDIDPAASPYAWTTPETPLASLSFRVTDTEQAGISDVSGAIETYIPIILTAPNGGELLIAGTENNIQWTSDTVENVRIEYSADNGESWTTLTDDAPADGGSYSWILPEEATAQGLIRISDSASPGASDVSDAVFSVLPRPALTLSSPNGGEIFYVGSQRTISWQSITVENISIEYSTDKGLSWQTISETTAAADQSYQWTVPSTVSDSCYVRLFDAVSAAADTSNAYFAIRHEIGEILVSSDADTVKVDEVVPFTAVVFNTNEEVVDVPLTWSVESDGEDIIGFIDEDGVFTGDLAGQGKVVAEAYGVRGEKDVTVEIVIDKIVITPEVVNAAVEDSVEFAAEVFDARGNLLDLPVSWSLEGEIGVLDSEGLFIATAIGEGAVIASVGDLTQPAGITIIESLQVSSIAINAEVIQGYVGDQLQFNAIVLDDEGQQADVQVDWSVNENIGSITNEGLLTATAAGRDSVFASVTVADSTHKAFVAIAIHVQSVSLPEIRNGGSIPLADVGYPLDFLDGASLSFPSNSVSDEISIDVKLPENASVDDAVGEVSFSEGALTAVKFEVKVGDEVVSPYYFNEPIQITIPFDSEKLAARGIEPEDLGMYFITDSGALHEHGITNIAVDSARGLVTATVAHFSEIAIVEAPPEQLLGDFNNDEVVDFVDYTCLVAGINSGSGSGDICGPATPIPNLVYEAPWTTLDYPYPPDGACDFEDIIGFAAMYNWFNSGGVVAKLPAVAKTAVYDYGDWGVSADETESYAIGDRFTVSFDTVPVESFLGAEMTVSYDSAVLRVTDVSSRIIPNEGGITTPVNYAYGSEDGILKAATVVLGPVASGVNIDEGDLFDVEFEIIGSGNYTITLEDISVRNCVNEDMPLSPALRTITGTVEDSGNTVAKAFGLLQNSPNPFNMGTTIPYVLDAGGEYSITIYNMLGQEVLSFSEEAAPGMSSFFWDGRDSGGFEVTSGVYIVRMRQGRATDTRRIMLLK